MTDLICMIHSGNHNRWIWHYWYSYFKKYWPFDCGIDVVFLCEHTPPTWPNITTFETGICSNKLEDRYNKKMWSDGLIEVLQRDITATHILYLLEDYFLLARPNVEKIKELKDIMVKKAYQKINIFTDRYNHKAQVRNERTEENLVIIQNDILYLASMQPAIWNRDFMLQTLRHNERSWDFEISGSERIRQTGIPTYMCNDESEVNRSSIIPYKEIMRLGKIRKGEAETLINNVKLGLV